MAKLTLTKNGSVIMYAMLKERDKLFGYDELKDILWPNGMEAPINWKGRMYAAIYNAKRWLEEWRRLSILRVRRGCWKLAWRKVELERAARQSMKKGHGYDKSASKKALILDAQLKLEKVTKLPGLDEQDSKRTLETIKAVLRLSYAGLAQLQKAIDAGEEAMLEHKEDDKNGKNETSKGKERQEGDE